jgi:ubiquinone/menaquinone biosynthesis C-methylase UbiE
MTIEKDVYALNKEVYDSVAGIYANEHFNFDFWKVAYNDFMHSVRPGSRVLDVGCGPGRDVKYLTDHGYSVIGVDYSEGMLEEARKRVPGGDFRKMDMRRIDFQANEFDAVWACASLLHVRKADAPEVLAGFRRVLKPEGILCVMVKQGEGEMMKRYPGRPDRFLVYYNEAELKQLLDGNGFAVLSLKIKIEENVDTWLVALARKVP